MNLSPHPKFSGLAEQRQYEAWLRTFPPETVQTLKPIADKARAESALPHNERDIATLMKRPHIRDAVQLGAQDTWVHRFNELVIQLNTRRLDAKRSGLEAQIQAAQEPLTDLGKALNTVLKESENR